MRWLALLAAIAGAACVDDRYRCTSHDQCDVGEGGRCEADQRCSYWDATCPAGRRYADHAGDVSGVCVDDRVVPANPCADGQPPAKPEGCFADVCAAEPACCATGWSAACVQQAQLRCPEVRCDTRIAVTAKKNTVTELWDLRWDGTAWSATAVPDGELVAWLAPARATTEPRLARLGSVMMTVGDVVVPYGARTAQSAASVDLDRTGSDLVAIGAGSASSKQYIEIADLETGEVTETPVGTASTSAWGDFNHDGFPDAVYGGLTSNRSTFIIGAHSPSTPRAIVEGPVTDLYYGSGPTAGQSSQIRSYDWSDVTGDGLMDVVIGGIVTRVHEGAPLGVRDVALETCDCDPLKASDLDACTAATTFASTVVPSLDATTIWIATFPYRVLTTLTLNPTVLTPVPLPVCTDCPPFVALAARDLDGDHALDLIAIDYDLGVWHLLADGSPIQGPFAIPTTLTAIPRVRISVTGAPRP
jgi:hypothetical protein